MSKRNTSLVQMFLKIVRSLQSSKRRNKLLAKTIKYRPNIHTLEPKQLIKVEINRLY